MTIRIPEFVPTTKIIAKEDLDTITDIETYTHGMRMQLERLEQECLEHKAAAQQEGYNEGVQLGRKDAFEAMAHSLEEVRERFLALENELSEVVITAVEKIIGQVDQHELTQRIIAQALVQMTDQVTVTILCSPEDHPSIYMDVEEIRQHIMSPHIMDLNIDPLLQPGEILVETAQGRVHIGLAHQLARLRANLKG